MSLEGSTFSLINDDNSIRETDTRIDDKYLKYNLNKKREDSGAMLLTTI